MASRNLLKTFETFMHQRKITRTEFDMYDAETQEPISSPAEMKEVLRRFFTLYGINPSVQFADAEFKESFVNDVTSVITRYYPTLSRRAFELAIELNLTNYFNLEKKPEVYGDRVNANFLIEVLNIYMRKKGSVIQKLDKMVPEEQKVVDPEETYSQLMDMLREDIEAAAGGNVVFRLPDMYYDALVAKGQIIETDEMMEHYKGRAIRIVNSMKEIAKRKENAPLSLKDLDITRQFLNKSNRSVVSVAKNEVLIDYIKNPKLLCSDQNDQTQS